MSLSCIDSQNIIPTYWELPKYWEQSERTEELSKKILFCESLCSIGFQRMDKCCNLFLAHVLANTVENIMAMTRTTTEKKFGKDIIESGILSIVEFKTEWSGSCQIVAPIFESLATSYKGLADFYIVDIEEEKTIALTYAIIDVPTILFFKNGEVIDYVAGLSSKNMLKEKIETALNGTKK